MNGIPQSALVRLARPPALGVQLGARFTSRIEHNPSIEAGHVGRTVAMNGPAFLFDAYTEDHDTLYTD